MQIEPRHSLGSFREVIGHFASGVTIITTRDRGKRYGMTASAVSSLSLEPPMLLVCINRAAPTCAAVAAGGRFGVNILGEDQGELAERFARPRKDKFEHVDVVEGRTGIPMLAEALARIECRVVKSVTGGTHTVYFAEVESAEAGEGAPLAYFRGRFGRLELGVDEAVYASLRQRVLEAGSDLGEELDAAALARELKCERWHVFHALTRLVSDGLVTWEPERGYVIVPVDPRTVVDALDARCAIQLGAAQLSVGQVTENELAELRWLMSATLPLIEDGRFVDVDRYAIADAAFHEKMVALAGSESLLSAFRRLSIPGIISRTLRLSGADDGLLDDHRQLVEAYEQGDLELALATICRHTERAKWIHNAERTAWTT